MPDGRRIYAIGDIHGRLDLLSELMAMIERDDAARDAAATSIVLLGDLVDRGPDSAGVVRSARAIAKDKRFDLRLIMGNHEELLLLAVAGDARAMRLAMEVGGEQTLRSFGLADDDIAHGGYRELAQLVGACIPEEDLAFLRMGENMVVIGDYAFVHAGVRPGIALAAQDPADLRWIRREFLTSGRDHGKVVVHGHTPTDAVEDRPNRIGIDTGAYATGRLSAVRLERDERAFLCTGGVTAPSAGRRDNDSTTNTVSAIMHSV